MKLKKIYTLLLALLATHAVMGQSLDNSFGQGGIVTTALLYDRLIHYIVRQADGKLIVAGEQYDSSGINCHIAAARYLTSGILDSTFGTNGLLFDPLSSNDSEMADKVVIQADQKIVIAGRAFDSSNNVEGILVRYTNSGTRDSSFGLNGIVSMATIGRPHGLAIQADGKIIVLGDSNLKRYNTDGTIDTNFGTVGYVQSKMTTAYELALQPDGKILLGGKVVSATNYFDMAMQRFWSDGRVDSSFGVNGLSVFSQGVPLAPVRLVLDANGKIVVAGDIYDFAKNGWNMTVFRFNTNGTLDSSFNNQTLSVSATLDNESTGILIQPDEKIVLCGVAMVYGSVLMSQGVLVRLNADGSTDNVFGQNGDGIFTSTVPSGLEVMSILSQPDGKIVASGFSTDQAGSHSVLLRYNMNNATIVANANYISSNIIIYPNPANNQLFIDINNLQTKTDCRFELNDITGKVMASGTLKTGVNIINTSSFANGLYLLQITNGAERMVSKVVKE